MRYLTGLMLFMLAHIASAVECRVNGSAWADAEKLSFNVYVDVKASTSLTDKILLDYAMDCRHNSATSSNPVLRIAPLTTRGVVLAWPYVHLTGGLRFNDTNYPIPVASNIILATHRNEPYVSVGGRPYLNITRTPGNYMNIQSSAGEIARVNLFMHFTNNFGSKSFDTTIFIYPRNSLNLNPSTCTINDDKPIEVDFGSVDPVAIPESQYDSTTSRAVALNYSCPDLGITTPILIILQGSGALFNLGGLATSNTDLAIRMVRNNGGVPVGLPFGTNITNSSGGDTVVFSLYRKPGSVPAAGPFTASGTLVMSVP